MKKATEDILDDIASRVFAMPIDVLWKSLELMPGAGERRSQSRGSNGYEIVARQPYEPGDDPRDIDHYATAQSGDDTIITISFEEPRDITIATIVDVSRRMQFGTKRTDKRVVSAELLASILACADKTQDRVKVLTASETQVETRFGPRGAKTIFAPAMEAILEPPEPILAPQPGTATNGGFLRSLGGLRRHASSSPAQGTAPVESGKREAFEELPRTRSLVFVISDFIGLSDEEKEALRDAAAVHDVVCVVIQDRRERELPAGRGLYTFRDIVSGQTRTIWLNQANREQFKQNAQKRLDELAAFFTDANCDYGVFSTEQDADEVIPEMMRLFGGHRR